MQNDPAWIQLAEIIINNAWVLIALWLIWIMQNPLRDVVPRLLSFKGFGMAMGFDVAAREVAEVIEIAEKHPRYEVRASEGARNRAARRAVRAKEILEGTRLLWIDDRPMSNSDEQRMFKRLGVCVKFVTSTQEALGLLAEDPGDYDGIISDIKREEDGEEKKYAGLEFLSRYRERDGRLPLIFYVGAPNPSKGVPPGAFGVTNAPDELLHLVIDILERTVTLPRLPRRKKNNFFEGSSS